MREPGFYDVPEAEYHAGPEISHSGLVRILRSPAHYQTPTEVTPLMEFGKKFHCAVLTPDIFDKTYVVLPQDCKIGSGKGQQARKADFEAEVALAGKLIIDPVDLEKVNRMREAVREDPLAKELLTDGVPELAGYWDDPQYGCPCRMRMDWINKPAQIIVDLKKVQDAREHSFQRVGFEKGYNLEAAWYCYGATWITKTKHEDFRFIAAEDKPPWGVQVHQADKEVLELGMMEAYMGLEIYMDCLEKNQWPKYPPILRKFSVPGWKKKALGMFETIIE